MGKTKCLLLAASAAAVAFSCVSPEEEREEAMQKAPSAIVREEFIFSPSHAPTPQCHASTIVESGGGLVAAWFGGTAEKNKDVGIWVSRKESGAWTKPVEVANGVQKENLRYPCWNPVLFRPRGGPLYLFYKVGPDPRSWWGMFLVSRDDGRTWSGPFKLPEGILGPIKNPPVQLADGTILAPSSTESLEEGWRIHLEVSRDGGRTWSVIGPLNDPRRFNAIQPAILDHGGGILQMLSRSREGVIVENWSRDSGRTWSKTRATSLPNPNSGIDALALKDGRFLLVYNPTGGNWGPRTPLSVALSLDGKSWRRVLDLDPPEGSPPGEKEEYSYPTVIQSRDGLVHIVYTWNRKTIKHVVLDPARLYPK